MTHCTRWLPILATVFAIAACASNSHTGAPGSQGRFSAPSARVDGALGSPAPGQPSGTAPPSSSPAGAGSTAGSSSAVGYSTPSSAKQQVRETATAAPPGPPAPPPAGVCPPPPPTGHCPDPCACPDYALNSAWTTDSTGHAVIHYRINPSGSGSSLSNDQIVAAINAGASTWMQADALVQLVYDGTTTDPPAFNNVVGYSPNAGDGVADVSAGRAFDIKFGPIVSQWSPCDPAHGVPCSAYYTGNSADDLQSVATHEWGHVLGVAHPLNQNDNDLTMYGQANGDCPGFFSGGYTCRYGDTLGYGDVLAVRKLYPTSAPLPTLYYP
jgi:hypothetical protein